MNKSAERSPEFYFSLPRFIVMLRGGDTERAESNAAEAWVVGLMMYLIHYVFFAIQFIPAGAAPWLAGLLLILTAFWVWLFWLFFLYINSVIIRFLCIFGFFRSIPIRRAQSILWGLLTTAMAWTLLTRNAWAAELGAIWLVTVALNLLSALGLVLRDAIPTSGK